MFVSLISMVVVRFGEWARQRLSRPYWNSHGITPPHAAWGINRNKIPVRFSLYRLDTRFSKRFPRFRDLVRLTTDFAWTGETGD